MTNRLPCWFRNFTANFDARPKRPKPDVSSWRSLSFWPIAVIAIPATGRLTLSSAIGFRPMSAGKPSVKRSSKWKLSSGVVGWLIVLFVFLGTLSVRRTGLLQFLEFHAYDFFVRHQPRASTSDPIVLVEMTEADIHSPSLDYPIYDDKLAELLRDLESAHPAVIGLDLWRDIPVPKSGVYLNDFNQVLQANSNIVAIFTLTGIAPPSALKSDPDRIAFNDNFPVDVEVDRTIPKVRRCALFAHLTSGETFDSLPFRLALLYLQRKGIEPQPDPRDPKALRLGKSLLKPLQPSDGAYVRAATGEFQILLDFKCPASFIRYSFGDALAGRIPPGSLRDKIVLIGMNSPSVSDERVTPISRDHHGIEVQALAINQLLRQALQGEKPLRFWNDWLEDGWILLWCIAGAAIAYWVRSPWRFALISAICLLGLAGTTWLFFIAGWWIPVATPAAGYVPAAVLAISYISAQERSMRAILMKLYSGQVSKEIAELTWANRDSFLEANRPLAQKLVVTVLFTDLKGFSTISEKLEPAELYRWLNGYLVAMAQGIQNTARVLQHSLGDGMAALSGVPVPHTPTAEQPKAATAAVSCALAMGRRLVE